VFSRKESEVPTEKAVPNERTGGFPRSSRLLKHADFQAVYQQGRKSFSGNLSAVYRTRRDAVASGPRVGFTVSKALGGAVVRNRIRRRLRSAVQKNLRELSRPLDIVLHPRKSVLDMDFAMLDAEIQQLFAAVEKGKGR
jgi:ribonuclease P protein component